jgi:hypothetical protein
MSAHQHVVFLSDVDNTLLDHDAVLLGRPAKRGEGVHWGNRDGHRQEVMSCT